MKRRHALGAGACVALLATATVFLVGPKATEAQSLPLPSSTFLSSGPVGITETQTARVLFTNTAKTVGKAGPVWVQLSMLDSEGETLATSVGDPFGEGPNAGVALLVQPGKVVSLELFGGSLSFPGGIESILFQPVVRILYPPRAEGIATLELEDSVSPFTKYSSEIPTVAFQPAGSWHPPVELGPVTLRSDETARLNLSTYQSWNFGPSWATLSARMQFQNGNGDVIGTAQTVELARSQSASIELDGTTYQGVLVARVEFLAPSVLTKFESLEIIDTATGKTKYWLSYEGQGGSGKGGGGGDT